MRLMKVVPARTVTVTFTWCRKDHLEMTERYRYIRSGYKQKLDKCYWCNHKFVDGEMMAIAHAENIGNKVLCGTCADKVLAS
jgi:uncharacterized CHY-type Zn-finger protein